MTSLYYSEVKPNDGSIRWWHKLTGAFAIMIFVGTWLCSIASPVLVLASIYYQQHILTSILVIVISIAYLPFDKKILAFRDFMRDYHICYYNQFSIDFESPPPSNKTFYAVHPHGIYCMGWSILFLHPIMAETNVKFCFSPLLYKSPFFRLLTESTGNPGKADKSSLTKYMSQLTNIAMPPGGFEEATISCPNQDRVYNQKRTGFIKLCLKYGYSVSPVYVFGENTLFYNVQGLWNLRLAMNRYGMPAILAFGNILSPWLLPKYDKSVHIVVGKPIPLPHIPDPTPEQIQLYHKQYQKALQTLYDTHAPRFSTPSEKLEVW